MTIKRVCGECFTKGGTERVGLSNMKPFFGFSRNETQVVVCGVEIDF